MLSFPFLIFLVPIVGPSLHHAKPTAYDKQGMLVPKLTTAQIKLMVAKAEKDRQMREGGGNNPALNHKGKARAAGRTLSRHALFLRIQPAATTTYY